MRDFSASCRKRKTKRVQIRVTGGSRFYHDEQLQVNQLYVGRVSLSNQRVADLFAVSERFPFQSVQDQLGCVVDFQWLRD